MVFIPKRRWIWVLLVTLLLALAVRLVLLGNTDQVTRDNFGKIRGGMTLEEVNALLGSPYNKSPLRLAPATGLNCLLRLRSEDVHYGDRIFDDETGDMWIGNSAVIEILFHDGEVVHKSLYDISHEPRERLLDRLRGHVREWLLDR